ncbi:MAG: hypothetical protein QM820_02935 [Minicystis sp.]
MPRSRRTIHLALGIYAAVTLVCLLTTAPERLAAHTPFNHFALLADSWVHGRLDLGRPPPAYTGNNDFASYGDRWFVSFPPFPAVLIAPFVKLAGSAEATRDGLFFGLLTGVGPAVLFLALDKLSRTGRSRRSTPENAALALLFAFGTVYWFSAVQGTVWFVAHVVGVALASIYLYACIDADHPVIAGLALALGFATRTSLGFAFPLFLYESWRAAVHRDAPADAVIAPRVGLADGRALLDRLLPFGAAVSAVMAILFWHNRARFGDAFEFGHKYLAITWRGRMDRWGLESYHYLGRNLAVVLTSVPYTNVAGAPFQINVHGLALWITSPFYAWALWPKRTGPYFWALALTVLAVAAPVLLYQNSGWIQFGYRFSNDFAPFVIALIAVGGRRLSAPFWLLAAFAIVVNAFGALTFQRAHYARYYFVDGTQKILHQPD